MKRGPGSKVDKLLCFGFFSNCSLTLLHINKLMTKSHRELPWITGKSRGKETSFFLNSSKQGLLTATDETGLLFSFTSAIHPPHWASFWSVSFPPSLFFSPRRKWPWRVGRLWAEASQSRFEKRGRRSETSRWIFRPHVGAARARTHTHTCVYARALQRGVVSAGWPDTGVGFRGCLGNEAETIPLTPFWRQTGKVTLES